MSKIAQKQTVSRCIYVIKVIKEYCLFKVSTKLIRNLVCTVEEKLPLLTNLKELKITQITNTGNGHIKKI